MLYCPNQSFAGFSGWKGRNAMSGMQAFVASLVGSLLLFFGVLTKNRADLRAKDKELAAKEKEIAAKEKEQQAALQSKIMEIEAAWNGKVLEESQKIREYHAANEEKLLTRIEKLDTDVNALREANNNLRDQVTTLKELSLKKDEQIIKKDRQIDKLERLNTALTERNQTLEKRNTELYAQVELLSKENSSFAAKLKDVEERVAANEVRLSGDAMLNGERG